MLSFFERQGQVLELFFPCCDLNCFDASSRGMFHHLSSDEHNLRTPIVCIASNCELAFALLFHTSVAHDRARFVFHWKSTRVIISLVFCCIQCRTRALAVSRISGKRLYAFATERSRTVVLPHLGHVMNLSISSRPKGSISFIQASFVSYLCSASHNLTSITYSTNCTLTMPLNCGNIIHKTVDAHLP